MALPEVGAKAPEFRLLNQLGETVSLASFAGTKVVLYFYPKALTPGCTTQACGLRDTKTTLDELNVVVLGVSPDPVSQLKKFAAKHQLNFDLLSDPDHQVAERYGVWGLKKFMGKEYMGVARTTFLIDEAGCLAAILDDFKTTNHHEELVKRLRQL